MKFSDLPDCAQREACALLSSKYYNTKEDVNSVAKNIAHAFCVLFEYEKSESHTHNDSAEIKSKPDCEFKNMFVGIDPATEKDSTVFIASYNVAGSFVGYVLYNDSVLAQDKSDCGNDFKYSLDQHVIAKSGIGYGRIVSRNKSDYGLVYAVNIESGAMKGKTLYFEESTLYGVP
ncbi:hypothetical protein D3C79_225740 [compost metagenome]